MTHLSNDMQTGIQDRKRKGLAILDVLEQMGEGRRAAYRLGAEVWVQRELQREGARRRDLEREDDLLVADRERDAVWSRLWAVDWLRDRRL